MTDIERNISVFTVFHSMRVEAIATLATNAPDVFDSVYKKLLYVALLDTLSKSLFPTRGNRDRMVAVLLEFADWKEASRISLPHLVRLLQMVPDPAFQDLRQLSFKMLDSWQRGKIVALDSDPTTDEIRALWPKEKEHRILLKGVSLESLQHANLFYTYRNSLVHELRHPGFPLDVRNDGPPYYIGRIQQGEASVESQKLTYADWELVYPLGFFKDICSKAIHLLDDYFTRNRLDPLSSFRYGSYWLSELN